MKAVAEADAYLTFDPAFGEEWLDLEADGKVRRLVAAARRLDLLTWSGKQVSATQGVAWSRTDVTNPDDTAFWFLRTRGDRPDELPVESELEQEVLGGDDIPF